MTKERTTYFISSNITVSIAEYILSLCQMMENAEESESETVSTTSSIA